VPQKTQPKRKVHPPQRQRQPGIERRMRPRPRHTDPKARGCDRLKDKVALITGGDSGIGRAVAIAFAKEGADVAIAYLDEHEDALETKRLIEAEGRRCVTIAGDVGEERFCELLVTKTLNDLGSLDILVNNAAEQHPQKSIEKISAEQLERTFRTNIFSYFFLTKARSPTCGAGRPS
jgi:NAD(P)-dependent dehydrogenase (short-subunit alcohol dehydrogenase family)